MGSCRTCFAKADCKISANRFDFGAGDARELGPGEYTACYMHETGKQGVAVHVYQGGWRSNIMQ